MHTCLSLNPHPEVLPNPPPPPPRLLARRLYGGRQETFESSLIPTAVFTPLEYACVGIGEEEAIAAFGDERVEVENT